MGLARAAAVDVNGCDLAGGVESPVGIVGSNEVIDGDLILTLLINSTLSWLTHAKVEVT